MSAMRWQDLAPDGTWTIPAEARQKGTAGELKLPQVAIAIIDAQPKVGDNPYLFPASRSAKGREHAYATNFGKRKAALDAKVAAALGAPPPSWTLHDLRRTSRSLLSRAGVRPDIAERVLGHVQPGVAGIYDRHAYFDEKAAALAKLAALIDTIVNPRDTVVAMRKPAKGRR